MMKPVDFVLLAIVAVIVYFAFRAATGRFRNNSCCGGGDECCCKQNRRKKGALNLYGVSDKDLPR